MQSVGIEAQNAQGKGTLENLVERARIQNRLIYPCKLNSVPMKVGAGWPQSLPPALNEGFRGSFSLGGILIRGKFC